MRKGKVHVPVRRPSFVRRGTDSSDISVSFVRQSSREKGIDGRHLLGRS